MNRCGFVPRRHSIRIHIDFISKHHVLNQGTHAPWNRKSQNLGLFESLRSLEMDYSRAPCLGADQKTRGLWERDCALSCELRAEVPLVSHREERARNLCLAGYSLSLLNLISVKTRQRCRPSSLWVFLLRAPAPSSNDEITLLWQGATGLKNRRTCAFSSRLPMFQNGGRRIRFRHVFEPLTGLLVHWFKLWQSGELRLWYVWFDLALSSVRSAVMFCMIFSLTWFPLVSTFATGGRETELWFFRLLR